MSTTKPHKQVITDLQSNLDQTLLISSSKDSSAKVCVIEKRKFKFVY